MRIAVLGSGAVGGYYGALLARAGHDVTFIARGAHLDAIRSQGLRVRGPLGDWHDPRVRRARHRGVGHVDLVLFAVKTYDNDSALPLLGPLVGESTIVLTLQNGVDSPDAVAAIVGQEPVVGGAAYIATALSAPGVIDQTGTYRRIAFGEVFDRAGAVTPRVASAARGVDRGRHPIRTSRRRPRSAVGEVHVPGAICRDDRRGPSAGRRDPQRAGRARAVAGGLRRSPRAGARRGRAGRRRPARPRAGVRRRRAGDDAVVVAHRPGRKASASRWRRCRAPSCGARRFVASPCP